MNQKVKRTLQWLGAIFFGAVCVKLAFGNIDWNEFLGEIQNLEGWPMVFCMGSLFATHFMRAVRWQTIMNNTKRVRLKELFYMNSVGFLGILIMPFRLGEFVRPLMSKKKHNIPMSTGLAFVLIERLMDGIVSTLILALGFMSIAQQSLDVSALRPKLLVKVCLIFFLGILGVCVFCVLQRNRAIWFLKKIMLVFPQKIQNKCHGLVEKFIEGLMCLPDLKTFLTIFVQSVLVWGVAVYSYTFLFKSFHLELPFLAGCTLIGISALGLMIPGPPGFIGTFHFFIQSGLLLYGVSRSVGLAYASVYYVLNLTYIVGAGVFGAWMLSMQMKGLVEEVQSSSEQSFGESAE